MGQDLEHGHEGLALLLPSNVRQLQVPSSQQEKFNNSVIQPDESRGTLGSCESRFLHLCQSGRHPSNSRIDVSQTSAPETILASISWDFPKRVDDPTSSNCGNVDGRRETLSERSSGGGIFLQLLGTEGNSSHVGGTGENASGRRPVDFWRDGSRQLHPQENDEQYRAVHWKTSGQCGNRMESFEKEKSTDGQCTKSSCYRGTSRDTPLESLDERTLRECQELDEILRQRVEDIMPAECSQSNLSSSAVHSTDALVEGGCEAGGSNRDCSQPVIIPQCTGIQEYPIQLWHRSGRYSSQGTFMQGRLIDSGSSSPNQEKRNNRRESFSPYKQSNSDPLQQSVLRRREFCRGLQRGGKTSQGFGHYPLDVNPTLHMQGNHTPSTTMPEAVSYHPRVSSQGSNHAARTLQHSETSRKMGLPQPLCDSDMLCTHYTTHAPNEVQNGSGLYVDISKRKTYWLRIKDLPRHIQKILNSVSNLENVAEVWYAIRHFILKKFSKASELQQRIEFENILNCIISKCMTTEQFFNIVGESCGRPIPA